MDSLGSLNAFVQAAESRSFTVAGRQLGVSSSAIGKAVARMEERLGVRPNWGYLVNQETRRGRRRGLSLAIRCGKWWSCCESQANWVRDRGVAQLQCPEGRGRLRAESGDSHRGPSNLSIRPLPALLVGQVERLVLPLSRHPSRARRSAVLVGKPPLVSSAPRDGR
jgi:hypothetical protein